MPEIKTDGATYPKIKDPDLLNKRSKWNFFILWHGQLISMMGSIIAGFALGVWVYQTTRSATLFGMMLLAIMLPKILFGPLAGVIADRFDRKKILLLGDLGSGLSILLVALLLFTNQIFMGWIFLGLLLSSLCHAFQVPAYDAAVSQLVPKEYYAKASGMFNVALATSELVGPLLGGVLVNWMEISQLMMIDFLTFVYAVGTILVVKIPLVKRSESQGFSQPKLFDQIIDGFQYFKERSGLLVILLTLFMLTFLTGFLAVLIPPMILSFSTPQQLGMFRSIIAIGMVISSVLVAIFGAPRRLVQSLFTALFLIGICCVMIGVLGTNYYAVFVPGFAVMAIIPVLEVCIDTLLRKKVCHEMQGRVFATLGMVTELGLIISIVIAGPVAEQWFEPFLLKGGLLASTVGKVIGIGPGRGIALMFILCGVGVAILSIVSYSVPKVKSLELELPDAT